MSFSTIGGFLTYISKKDWALAEDFYFKNKSAIARGIHSLSKIDSVDEKIISIIEQDYEQKHKDDSEYFYENYINFSFYDEDARENAQPILDSFCFSNGFAEVSTLRAHSLIGHPFANDLIGENTNSIQFNQYIPINKKRLFRKSFLKKDCRLISMVINLKEVIEISGMITSFIIITKKNKYYFSHKECYRCCSWGEVDCCESI